jgi:hypothetical protein
MIINPLWQFETALQKRLSFWTVIDTLVFSPLMWGRLDIFPNQFLSIQRGEHHPDSHRAHSDDVSASG